MPPASSLARLEGWKVGVILTGLGVILGGNIGKNGKQHGNYSSILGLYWGYIRLEGWKAGWRFVVVEGWPDGGGLDGRRLEGRLS